MEPNLKSTIQSFISKSHPIIQDFINSGDLAETIEEICDIYHLNEDETTRIENIVLTIIIGISSPEDLIIEINEITSIPKETAQEIAESIEDIILNVLSEKIEKSNKSNSIGNSFEEIIKNQAIAMQPAIDKNSNTKSQMLNQSQNNEQRVIHNYVDKPDPYRESV